MCIMERLTYPNVKLENVWIVVDQRDNVARQLSIAEVAKGGGKS